MERINWSTVKCEGCGNCCPNSCPHKKDNLCNAHPTVIGKEAARSLQGLKCAQATPLSLFSFRVYCPPVIRIIEQHYKIKAIPKITASGAVWVDNFEEVAEISRKLRGLK